MDSTVSEKLAKIETLVEIVISRQEEDRNLSNARANDVCVLKSDVEEIKRSVKRQEEWRLKEVTPFINSTNSLKSKIAGAGLAFGLIGSIVIGGATYFKAQVLGWLGWA